MNEEKKLQGLPQYHLDRDFMIEIVAETIGVENLLDIFDYGQFHATDEFAWFRQGDEFYIIHLESGMMVNWYKHLGRTNTCSQKERTAGDYYEFFKALAEEVDYCRKEGFLK